MEGKTFRWGGRYGYDFNARETTFTELGAFADFVPRIPQSFRDTPHVFLANIQPDLQLQVREQCTGAQVVGLDSMNLWIETAREERPPDGHWPAHSFVTLERSPPACGRG